MDLKTTYLGLELPHPIMPGASPMVDDIDTVRRLEDAGAAAIVMHSLFEEQIAVDQRVTAALLDQPRDAFAEALSYLPATEEYALGPEEYLRQLERIRRSVAVPVIASLNGTSEGRWLDYARMMQEAGADALELNVYQLVTDARESAAEVEDRILAMVRELGGALRIPLAVKLSPFFTALPHFALRLEAEGAAGLVLFNRFYQPDLDIEELEVGRSLELSTSSELLLRLRWIAILRGRLRASLAVTGGVHTVADAVKALMTGADAVQCVSALLQRGPQHLGLLVRGLEEWLEDHEYESLDQLRGSMSLERCPDPAAYERANYIRLLQSYRDV